MKSLTSCLALTLLLAGCQTPASFPTPDARWRTLTGQLQYATPAQSVIGEVVVSRLDSEYFQLEFVSGPGIPLMKLRQHENFGRAEGILARGSWQGQISRAPARLGSWFALHERLRTGARRRLTADFPASGERFVFHFNR